MDEYQVENFLEHHGIMGMHWGIRNKHPSLDRISRIARGTSIKTAKLIRKHPKTSTAIVSAAGAGVLATILGRRGMISIAEANTLANKRSGKLVRDIGHQFVTDSIDKKVVLNFGRQIKEGLINFK